MVQANQASHPTSRGLPWTLHETFTTHTGDYPARIPLDSNVHDSSWLMILSRIEQYTVYTCLYSIYKMLIPYGFCNSITHMELIPYYFPMVSVDSLWFPGGFKHFTTIPIKSQGIAMSPGAASSPGAPRPSVSHWAASWQHGFRLGTRKLAPVGLGIVIYIYINNYIIIIYTLIWY